MSGILDPKTRVIDTVITQEGKRQIATGGLRAIYATVSDRHSYYELDAVSGSTDATKRLHYEATIENNNDSIVMESDDSGDLLGYPMSGPEFIANDGTIFETVTIASETAHSPVSNPTTFASIADKVIDTAIDRFTNLQTIGTRDPDESLSLQMKIRPQSHTFTINNKFPFVEGFESATTNLEYVEPLFFDEMLANSPNFQYLPPVTRDLNPKEQKYITLGLTSGVDISFTAAGGKLSHGIAEDNVGVINSAKSKLFGSYLKYHRPRPMTLTELMRHLNEYPELRRLTDHANRTINPTPGLAYVDAYDGTIELSDATFVIRDPDADEDTGSSTATGVVWYSKSADKSDALLGPKASEGTGKKYAFESNNDSIGVYKSEEDSTSVNLTTEQLPRERVQVFFDPTSSTNNIIMQMFEVDSKASKLLKLDVIHYGEFSDPSGPGSSRPVKNVFFAGKIFISSIGLPSFINLFTIILD